MNMRCGFSWVLTFSAFAASCYPTNQGAAYIKGPPRAERALIPDEWLADCYAFIAVYDLARACTTVSATVQLRARHDLQGAFEQLRAARLGIPTGQAYELSLACTRSRAALATAMAAARCEIAEPNWLSTP